LKEEVGWGITVCVLGHLLGEKVVGEQGDALGDLGGGAEGLGGAVDCLLEVLHHELHVLVLGG
jgi:hypothetical protein